MLIYVPVLCLTIALSSLSGSITTCCAHFFIYFLNKKHFNNFYHVVQLCVWSIDTWEKRKSIPIQPAGRAPVGDTRVQFHSDQLRLLVIHDTQLAIYDASKMERIRQVGYRKLLLGLTDLSLDVKIKIELCS